MHEAHQARSDHSAPAIPEGWGTPRRRAALIAGVVIVAVVGQLLVSSASHQMEGSAGRGATEAFKALVVGALTAGILVVGLRVQDRRRRDLLERSAEGEVRFRAIADATPVMIWVVDDKHQGVYFNQRWLDFTGRPLEAELGDGWAETVHPDDRERAVGICLGALHARRPLEMEYRMRRHDGVYRWMLDRGEPRYSAIGEFLGMVGGCFDVTERHEATQRQEAATQLAARLAAASDTRGAAQAVADSLEVLTGVSLSSILLFGDDGVCRFVGWRGLSDEYRRAVEGHCPWARHATAPDPIVIDDARVHPMLEGLRGVCEREGIRALAFVPVVTEKGVAGKLMIYDREPGSVTSERVAAAAVAARYLGLAVDRLEAQERLAESEARRRQTMDTALDAVISMDARGRITDWNAQAAHVFGWTASEAIGKPLEDLIVPSELKSAHVTGLARVVAGGESRLLGKRIEVPAVHKDGTVLTVELAVMSLNTGTGISFSAFVRDITEKKRAEEELLKAKIEAEAASRAKSYFLANMSHEIRTPMTAILGFTDLLEAEGDISRAPAHRREAVATIKRHGEGLLQILNDILDISKIEAGKLEVDRVPMSPAQVVEDVVSLMRVRAIAKGISLDAMSASPIPSQIQSDPTRLRQILINLVGNAIKFTDRGGVAIRVGLDNGTVSGPRLVFVVRDSGIGISDEQLPRLFQAFEQADASVSRRYGGTGLGLRISQRLAEMLGGRIAVESRLHHGATFTLNIETGPVAGPMVEFGRGPDASEVMRSSTAQEASQEGTLRSVRVLLVEDGPDNQKLISFYLTRFGAEVRVAANGRIAAEMMSTDGTLEGALKRPSEFDLIVMDMQMPEMDGYTTTRWLRARGCDLPIVALTAHAMVGDREKCLHAGCTSYATKPIDRAALAGVCREALNSRGRAAA